MAKDIKFNIKLTVDGKQVVVRCKQDVRDLGEALSGVAGNAGSVNAALTRLASVSTLLRNGMNGIRQLGDAMQPFIAKANAATEAQTKLTTVMHQRMGATEADTAAVNDAVAAQTKLGIVGGTVQRSGLQQLATFSSQRQTLETLLPAMNNLLAQQKGLNATSEDAVGVANLMGKALMGNVGALTRVGITLTDQQKELIKTGDEYTRAKTLAQAITDNVGNMNAELAKTDAGQVKQLANSFGSLQVKVGKFFSDYQLVIAGFGQVGMAVSGIGQLLTAMRGLVAATGIASAASSLWHARTVLSTAATNLFAAAMNGASVGATTLKFALRGLMSATVIGAAVTLLGVGLEKLINYFTAGSNASGQFKQAVGNTTKTLSQQRDEALAPVLAKYQELQTKWKSLKSVHEKNEFLKANKTAFEQLGVSIDSVGTAESFFVKNTKAVEAAMYARAEAAAAASLAEEEMRKALEAESRVKSDREKDKTNYKRQNHTGKTGQDAAIDALVDSGAIKVTSKRTQRDVAELGKHRAAARSYSNRSASATARATAGLRPYQNGNAGSTTGTGGARSTGGAADKKALMGSLDWYDQKMQELRKRIYATNDEATAAGLQAQYEDLEQKSKNLKVAIGLEEPKAAEVKSYAEQLQDRLKEAQKGMDNATTVEARVKASAKVAEIQKEIDIATRGELSIEADVEPAYVMKGSVEDKRQSYQNAQSKVSRIQQDYEIGIIGKEDAERQVAEVNAALSQMGSTLKPLKIEVEASSLDKARESMAGLAQQFGGSGAQIGSQIMEIAKAMKAVRQAAKQTNKETTATGKGFSMTSSYATAGAAGLTAIGNALQQVGSKSAAAKAGAVMAAIGQIVLGFATYTAQSAQLGPWGWIAAVAGGLAVMASTIATLKGYASGGVLTGPTTSGDKLLFRGNAGEMIFNTAQQRRLYELANGSYLPRVERFKPRTESIGNVEQTVTINVTGRLKGTDMALMSSNTRSLGAKIGKRW